MIMDKKDGSHEETVELNSAKGFVKNSECVGRRVT